VFFYSHREPNHNASVGHNGCWISLRYIGSNLYNLCKLCNLYNLCPFWVHFLSKSD
jgi:hypothetical protein